MTSDGKTYVIDTDVLVRIRDLADSAEMYSGVIALAESGRVRTVRQVFDELKKHGPVLTQLAPHKAKFLVAPEEQHCAGVQGHIEKLGNVAAYLWEQTGGKNPDPADPWLIAVAVEFGYTVVTNEKKTSPQRIPAACKALGIEDRCVSGPHFLYEVGLVTEIKPEHISVAAFFGQGA